ncbi:11493_t:CDS:2 [Dentiscutata erythropus]|uniref:11493_t:CDS:1 n=1 Tax=Dentiscutata erythropus TaxID=1348616 RepID=A0A9N9AN48_9GLOM|nr:11493_t:CDS:2 [Dentiscutata erythropus]
MRLDNNESYLENVSEIPSTPKTTTAENTISDNDYAIKEFIFDKAALNHAKSLVTNSSEDFEDLEQNELDIDWLALDNDTLSVIESMWTSTTNNDHVNDYELSETNIDKDSSQYVVIDYIEGHLPCCPSSAILLEEIWLAIIKFFDKKSILPKNSIDNKDVDQNFKAKPPLYFAIKAALQLENALGEVIWRSRSKVCLQKEVLEAPNTFNEFHEVSHTNRYKRKLEKQRINNVDISKRLLHGEDIWNLCIMDNIDMKKSTFVYNKIFKTPRRTAYATLRIVLQFKLPKSLSDIAAECKSKSVSGASYKFKVDLPNLVILESGKNLFDRTTKSCEEALQNVTNLLVEEFNLPDSTKFELFSETSQNTDLGFKNLFECYERGIKCLEDIYKQDIEKSEEHNTTGRRAQDVVEENIQLLPRQRY